MAAPLDKMTPMIIVAVLISMIEVTHPQKPAILPAICDLELIDIFDKIDACLEKKPEKSKKAPSCVPKGVEGHTCSDGWLVWLKREDPKRMFWLEQKHLHAMTSVWEYTLRVELTDHEHRRTYAEYSNFKVDPEAKQYRLSATGYDPDSTAADIFDTLSSNDTQLGYPFATNERGGAKQCKTTNKRGWWHDDCLTSTTREFADDSMIVWHDEYNNVRRLRKIEFKMKAKPADKLCEALQDQADKKMDECDSLELSVENMAYEVSTSDVGSCFREPHPMIMGPVTFPSGEKVHVFCADGWLRWFRREDGTVNFTRPRRDYEDGFGFPKGEFWLGLRHLRDLTSVEPFELRVEATAHDGQVEIAEYSEFEVASAVERYMLTVDGYVETDKEQQLRLFPYTDAPFSTFDWDNSTGGCAKSTGGWWFKENCPSAGFPTSSYCKSKNDKKTCMMFNHTQLKSLSFKIRPGRTVVNISDCFDDKDLVHHGHARFHDGEMLPVSCDKGWLVWLRRQADSTEHFNRSWSEYMDGFGDPSGAFWLGLEPLYSLTKKYARIGTSYSLQIDLTGHDDVSHSATYGRFMLLGKSDGYMWIVLQYKKELSTLPEDLLGGEDDNTLRRKFTTRDKDHDGVEGVNCADRRGGGWWYNTCPESTINPTGEDMSEGASGPKAVFWRSVYGGGQSIKHLEMKIRPNT